MIHRVVGSPIGPLRITEHDGAITEVAFVEDGEVTVPPQPSTQLLEDASRQLDAYFRGELVRFDLPLNPDGTAFQKRVWGKLVDVQFGATCTCQEIADTLATSARPVGGANGANPIAIVVPCHRVVGTHGLTGYAGGLWRKRWLLTHEGALPEQRQGTLL